MSNPISNIAYGIKWSIASVGCFAVYAATMIPFVWRTRNSGIGLREEKDRSSLYPRLFTEDGKYGHHRYIDIGDGKKFHVVESGKTDGPLVFFLHGFPQCWYTWKHQLAGLKDDGYHLAAMDMVRRINVHRLCHRMQLTQANGTVRKRGYGTSYRSKKKDYVMREFISDVRGVIEALQKDKPVESRRVTLVAHDWGAIVAWHVLADSWKLEKSDQGYIDKGVIINIGHPMVSLANIVQPFKEYFKIHWLLQLITKPKSTSATLHKAFAPVFAQLMKSYYIYIFQLPTPFGRSFAKLRDWYFQGLIIKGIKTSTPDDVEMYKAAAAYGPPEDPTPGFDHAVEYYRHGAAVEGWSLSKPEDGYIGYPVLVLWGEDDIALDLHINTDNVNVLVPAVDIKIYPGVGHFLPEEIPDELSEQIRRFAAK